MKKIRGKPFEKGKSGNPAGRPKSGMALSDILRERVDAAKLADALLGAAYSDDVAALKAVYDRIDGTTGPVRDGLMAIRDYLNKRSSVTADTLEEARRMIKEGLQEVE